MSGLELGAAAAPAAAGTVTTGAGAGLATSTASGLGAAEGLGLMGAAATPALSLAAAPAGATLASGALGGAIPALGAGLPSAGISTLGGVAPQLMGAGPSWLESLWSGAQNLGGKAGQLLNSDMGKMVLEQGAKRDDGPGQPAPALGGMAPRSGADGGGGQVMTAEDQMNALLSRLFAAQGA